MKKFQFKLDTVMDYKQQVLDALRGEHAAILAEVHTQEEWVEHLWQEYRAYSEEYRQRSAEGLVMTEALMYQTGLRSIEQEIQRETEKLDALRAKEEAKRRVKGDPSAVNLAALDRADKMLRDAMQTKTAFKDYKAVLAYAEESGRKLGKSKLYLDIQKGRLKKQPDGTFKQRDVDRYLASVAMSGTLDPVAERAADRQRRKEEAEIRRIEAVAKKEEFALAVAQGKFVPKERVHLELAGRAATLASSLKTAIEARNLDLIALVEGNPKKSAAFVEMLENFLDEAMSEYSREMEIEVSFTGENQDGNSSNQ